MGLASQRSADALGTVKAAGQQILARARASVEANIGAVRLQATQALTEAMATAERSLSTLLQHVGHMAAMARATIVRGVNDLETLARKTVETARDRSEALMREIAGQGPEKTLNRGFAVVRTADGRALTRAVDAAPDQAIEMQFSDGCVGAVTQNTGGTR